MLDDMDIPAITILGWNRIVARAAAQVLVHHCGGANERLMSEREVFPGDLSVVLGH
jgi:hypothetical protein